MKGNEAEIAKAEKIIAQLLTSGVPEEAILAQLESFARGFPAAKIIRPCTMGDGLIAIPADLQEELLAIQAAAARRGRFSKFVPASGAATRMFKSLAVLASRGPELDHAALKAGVAAGNEDCLAGEEFFSSLARFPFFQELKLSLAAAGLDLAKLLAEERYHLILTAILGPEGLNYGNLPKGLIKFHRYPEGNRTPFAEHLVEAANYTADGNGVARIHFTVAPEHLDTVDSHIQGLLSHYAPPGGRLEVSFSSQKPASVTIAVDAANEPLRADNDLLVFRPAGHGALLSNLNELQGDLVYIKNIDNVAPDHLKGETYRYKRLLGGLLVMLQERIFKLLSALESADWEPGLADEISCFARQWLNLEPNPPGAPEPSGKNRQQLAAYWFAVLNRPLRVCGMVRNQGEPGGGPFWVLDEGKTSVQIVEKAQIDLSLADQQQALAKATHFNPVDLVCGLRNYRGEPFDLPSYVNRDTGFVTAKSKGGKELKALELPGLWNGSMAYWNTVFMEVPTTTFSPVKTVNDLLRPEHQP